MLAIIDILVGVLLMEKIVQLTMKLSLYIYRHFCKPKVKYDVTTQYEDISGSEISKNSLSSVEITI
jgi:hypothetical protein